MRRKSPIKHKVRTHKWKDRVVAQYVRGTGSNKPKSKKLAKPTLNLIKSVPINEVSAKEFLLIPAGPSESGEHWQKGVMQATSMAGVNRNIKILKSKGWKSGRVLAPMAEQTGRNLGFRVIGHWGKLKKIHYGPPKYKLDKEMYQAEYDSRRGKKKLVWMTPEKFLKQCPSPDPKYKNAFDCPGSVVNGRCAFSAETLRRYRVDLAEGKELPVLVIDKTARLPFGGKKYIGHDGRHRAKAAWFMGVKRIPVLVIEEDEK